MKKNILLLFVCAALIITLLTGCVIPGTGTLRIRNEMTAGRAITALFLYKQGSSEKGLSIISSTLYPNENHVEYGVEPGDYTIEAEISGGLETALLDKTVEEGTYYYVNIYDSDIVP